MIIRSVIVIITAMLFAARVNSMTTFLRNAVKDSLYADRLFRKASGYEISADYDSSIFYYQSAAKEYRRRRYYEKYLDCRNKIISVKRNAGYNTGLITEANENIALSIRKLGIKSAVTGDCYFHLGNIYSDDRNLDSALLCYKTALDIRKSADVREDIPVADIYRSIGIAYSNKGFLDSARNNIARSLDLRREHFGEDDSHLASDYNVLGSIAYHLGQYDTCQYYFGRVVGIRERTSGYLHPLTAEAYNNLAVLFMEKAMWDTALVLNRKAYEIRLAKLPPNHPNIALSLNNLANVYMAMGDHESALARHRQALNMRLALHGTKDHTDIAMSYTNIGVLLRETGRYQEGLNYFLSALDILIRTLGEESPYTAAAYNNVGAAYDNMGDYNNCLKYLKKAMSLRLHRGPDAPGIPRSYNNIGTVYKKKGDLDLALSYYRISYEINKKLFDDHHPDLASNYRKMGEIFLLKGQNDTALNYYNKALNIDTCVIDKDNPAVIEDYLNRGTAYGRLDDPVRELDDYLNGLELSTKIYGETHPLTGKFYSKIACNMLGRQYADSAIFYMRRALRINKAVYPSRHPEISSAYNEMGFIYESTSFPDSAKVMYNNSIRSNYQGDPDKNRIETSLVINGPMFASSLINISRLKYNEYFRSKESNILEDIIYYFNHVRSITEAVVSDFLLEETKIGLLNQLSTQTVYAVDAACRLYHETGGREYLFKALEFSELNKASLLQDLVFRFKGEENTIIPDSLLHKRKELLGYIDYLQMQLKQREHKAGAHEQIKREYIDSLLISLREINDTISRYSVYDTRKSFTGGRQLYEAVTSNLEPGSALISYFLNDTILFTFVVSDDTLVLNRRRLDPAGILTQQVESYLTALRKYEKDKVPGLGYEIYNLVFSDIEPVVRDKKKLIIIPDKYLLYLPFETLCKRHTSAENFSDFRYQPYLINDFGITYHYSAALWASAGTITRTAANRLLAFAPAFSDQGGITGGIIPAADSADHTGDNFSRIPVTSFTELPWSLKETDSLHSLSLKCGIGTDIFTGQNASEKNLKENIMNHRYIHIATHVISHDALPEYSGLLFSDCYGTDKSGRILPDDNIEGILHAWEIYPMTIDAELVTMSACESGLGKLEEGEGMIGLVRAFLSAGAGNVLFSYWKVGDKNTMMFMRDFYDHAFTGDDFGTALRKTKLAMIDNPETSFPLLWGAFAIIGHQPEYK